MTKVDGMANEMQLLSTAEVAIELGCSHSTVSRWVRAGKLKPAVEGAGLRGPRFFRRAEVQRIKRTVTRNLAA
ncbi:helix-turn-helix domain-containing protein [Gulosibacter sediminis]|uniref:helix-turn-helix domain-containing protein n=1 Tax=Gulosibacter sediminis TaxID=1729695 RepID=UPI0024A7D8C6|nr:helix-turn-helix domain-containing protein [Gulosibacter sediminis]